jgi:DNA-binding transcriptional MerR regulator
MADRGLLISELAELSGLTSRTIRHYEQLGLIAEPSRGGNGYRRYGPSALLRLAQIRRLKAAGLRLADIVKLDLSQGDGGRADLLCRLDEIDSEIAQEVRELKSRRELLAQLRRGLDAGETILAVDPDPPSFRAVGDLLERLGASERAIDEQRRVWSALEGVELPGNWRDVIEARLERATDDPSALSPWVEYVEIIAELRPMEPDDPRIEDAADRLVEIADAVPPDWPMIPLSDPAAAPILTAVATCFTPAQLKALATLVMRVASRDAERARPSTGSGATRR